MRGSQAGLEKREAAGGCGPRAWEQEGEARVAGGGRTQPGRTPSCRVLLSLAQPQISCVPTVITPSPRFQGHPCKLLLEAWAVKPSAEQPGSICCHSASQSHHVHARFQSKPQGKETLLSVTIRGQESDASILLQKRENKHLPSRPNQPTSRERPTRSSSSHRRQFTLQRATKIHLTPSAKNVLHVRFPLHFHSLLPVSCFLSLSACRHPILFPSSSPPTLKLIAKPSQAPHNRSPSKLCFTR